MRRLSQSYLAFFLLPVLFASSAKFAAAQGEDYSRFEGAKIVVADPAAVFEVPGKSAVPAKVGTSYVVSQVNRSWLWVNRTGGWIDAQFVVLQSEADKHFTESLKAAPSSTAFYQRGMMWSGQGNFDRAIVDFEAALRMNPNNSLAHVGRANCLLVKGHFDKAVDGYTEAIETDQRLTSAYANRANAWQAQGQVENALQDFALAEQLEPGNSLLHNNRGSCYLSLGNFDKAIANYDTAIQSDPYYSDAFNNRGYAWYLKGDYEKAILDYRQAAKYEPLSAKAFNNAAWIRAACPNEKFRDGKRALKFAKRAIEFAGTDCWYCLGTLAAAYAETGDFRSAVRAQLKTIMMLPSGIDSRERDEAVRRLDLYLAQQPFRFSIQSESVAMPYWVLPETL